MFMSRGGDKEGDTTPLPVKEQPPPYNNDEEAAEKELTISLEEEYTPCIIRYITALARTVGILVVCVLWLLVGLLMNNLSDHKYAPWYLLSVSIITTFFEIIWMINKCVVSCMRQDGCCCAFWRFLVWIDNWKKTILYILFAIPCFLDALFTVETCIAGLLLFVTAGVYFMKSFKQSECVKRKRTVNAVVQTGTPPKTKIVPHTIQVGKDGEPPGYHSTHTLPETVQPRDRGTLTRTQSRSSDVDKRTGLGSPTIRSKKYEKTDSEDRPYDGDRYDRDSDRKGDRGYEKDRGRYRDEYDDEDGYRRDRERDRDRTPPRNRDYDRDRGRYSEKERDYRDSDRYSDRRRDRSDSRERYRDKEVSRRTKDGDKEKSKDSEKSKKKKQSSSKEPPPLKELPPQASDALKKSAAANLVKQVSSGSPVQTSTGSAPRGMPSKIEQKAANMSNPFETIEHGKSTNPFEEDEYFD